MIKTEKLHDVWDAAIGLQQVDGLQVSDHLKSIAKLNCDGEASFYEAENLILCYHYMNRENKSVNRTREADVVSVRIAEYLSGYMDNYEDFSLSSDYYTSIHKELFASVLDRDNVGKPRTFNIEKSESVLNGNSVIYGCATELQDTLEYDLIKENDFSYEGILIKEAIVHLAYFISRLWQIHVFAEGNTRTTAVFLIQYLKSMGYKINYEVFSDNSLYFRNALVRANYENVKNGIYETTEYLEKFISNLVAGTNFKLCNEELHIK